ncbi:hypothetical protein HRR83_002165 [Exophiala dermatitidis]|uniref:Uncharacterized protein n=2 Tax=Exophiala dermatitidis TaxID=5970 RepID=H6BYP1_EXODN|nr:uncharacterized protein HMPREF1120_04821 [Exophiala dermatitidis NIH/UT8656]KAJ4520195.1 hypothetical protein HRR75_002058 [Exophiala dermatitidis]EHY56754.1 hypothetical protein HMPREF1120_04821 [Exophiala dermatitidis NIH/UT8656]KAJ4524047.1 hypothetical protein HRR74_002242 [Exophiala dermatitidis]KAJ4525681.1 hypothetical protein HRR73_002413 [Exophiala dermatitidis]KAJ4537005.1 hypothetical protein HRR76_005025 [Exophiala dermatitidis]
MGHLSSHTELSKLDLKWRGVVVRMITAIPVYGNEPDGTEAIEHLAYGCSVDDALMEELLVVMGVYPNDPTTHKQIHKAGTCGIHRPNFIEFFRMMTASRTARN